jgi:uncharacterized protein YabN with tetrapyrrole methylase and pyrophosphatase domain
MRMTTFQFVADGGADIVEIKTPFFLRHLRIEHHLETQIDRLLGIMRRLRDPENGCPWDKEQTFATIAPYTRFPGRAGDA